MNTLLSTSFSLPGQQNKYTGKVREVFTLENDLLVMIIPIVYLLLML